MSKNDRTLYLAVGINEFKNFPHSTLNGCVNDAMNMARFFESAMPNATGQILTDSMATRSKVMSNLAKMSEIANQDRSVKRLAISISSHGSQVFDIDRDEFDELDECVLLHDTALAYGAIDRKTVIVDDDLYQYLQGIPARVRVEFFLDSCFSGTGVRLLPSSAKGRPRYLQNPAASCMPKRVYRFKRHDQQENVVLWTGCSDKETSADAEIGGKYHGAMTYAFLKAYKPELCRRSILSKMRGWLAREGYSQSPQLECKTADKVQCI